MRFSKAHAAIASLVLGLLFAVGNLWFTAVRSTIPLSLDGGLHTKEKLPEKHPGVDDVYLLTFAGGRTLQVDQHVFDAVAPQATLRKARWSRELHVDEQSLALRWSKDFRRMCWVMSSAIVACLLLCVSAMRRPRAVETHSP